MSLHNVEEILSGLPGAAGAGAGFYEVRSMTHAVDEAYAVGEACAVAAFNVHNMEFVQGVVGAAEDEGSPVILMIGEPMIPFAGLDMLVAICRKAAEASSVPMAIALDHGKKRENIQRCIELGVSVMFDGSNLPFQDNIALTKEYAALAHAAGVSIEGEIGAIGGAEDEDVDGAASLTDPMQAIEFAERTGVDALAISIGNRHGFYKRPPLLNMEILSMVAAAVRMPIVLHGGSDVPDAEIRKAIRCGIRKVNVGTELKYAFFSTLKERLNQDPMPYQPPAVLAQARAAVRELARSKIRLFRSAWEVRA
jgi:fructose-bisphosphate aldolase class II